MSFYRRITRERTLSSFNDLNTTDEGLKKSISSFSKTPREAKFYDSFKIKEDYYSKKGVHSKGKYEKSVSDAEHSDSDNRSYSWESSELRDLNDEKRGFKEKKSYSKKWTEKIPIKWFRKRTKSSDSYISEAKSSYGTDMSYSDSRSEFDKERSERMVDDDRGSVYERRLDRETISTRFDTRSKRGRKAYH